MSASRAVARRKATEDYNTRIVREHAELRAKILALRPGWSPVELETVRCSYGGDGLRDILDAIERADALDRRFAVASRYNPKA